MQINKVSHNIYSYQSGINNKQGQSPVAFMGATKSKFFEPISKPFNKVSNKITDKVAHGLTKLLGTKIVEKIVTKTKDNAKLVQHLTAFTGVILSGFYIKKTLENDKLDHEKKKTLAINQAIVCAFSTAGSYFIDSKIAGRRDEFIKKFEQINKHEVPENLLRYKNGIKNATSIMVFGLLYRFVGPVIATPIANAISNRAQAKKDQRRQQLLSGKS